MPAAGSTRLRAGARPDPRDAEIARACAHSQLAHPDAGVLWRFGVRNADGALYRDGTFTSFPAAMAFADRMEALGFVLEREPADAAAAGLHVVYVPRRPAPAGAPREHASTAA